MTSRQRIKRHAVLGGDTLRVVVEFLLRSPNLRLVSKEFALLPCSVKVPPSSDFPQLPSCVTSLVCKGPRYAMHPDFYEEVDRVGRFLVRLDVSMMVLNAEFDFLASCPVLKELYVQQSSAERYEFGRGPSGVERQGVELVINCPSLEVLDMSDTEFRVGDVPNLTKLDIRECPNPQVFPPSLTSLNCSYTLTPLWLHGLRLIHHLDLSGKKLPSLDFLKDMPLKVLFLTSCTGQDHEGEAWPLDAALLPLCVKLSVSHTEIYTQGPFASLEVFEMQQCPNEDVPDAPLLTALNCSDNDVTEEFIDGLKGLPKLKELKAAGCNEEEEIDFSGLVNLEYLAVPDTYLHGQPPLYGFPPNIRVVRVSEHDLEDIEERVRGLPADTRVYVCGFDVFDYEDPEESGLEGAWKSVPTLTLQELRDR